MAIKFSQISDGLRLGFRDEATGDVIFRINSDGGVALQYIQFSDGTLQTTAASSTNTLQTVSSNTVLVLSANQNLTVSASGGAGGITLTLPSAVGVVGQKIKIFKNDTAAGSVTVNTVSSQTINGSIYGTSYAILDAFSSIEVESDGANWLARTTAG